MNITNSEDAYKLLVDTFGGGTSRQIFNSFKQDWKDDISNVKVAYWTLDNNPESYKSELEGFPSMIFHTELEVNFANALFLLWKSSGKPFNESKFRMIFGTVFSLLEIKNGWEF